MQKIYEKGISMRKLAFLTLFCLIVGFLKPGFVFAQQLADTESSKRLSFPLRTWGSEEQRLQERRKFNRLYENLDSFLSSKQNPVSNSLKSIVLPGYGQFAAKKSLKGLIFTTTTLTTIGGGLYFLKQSNQKYDKYKSADNIDDIERYFDDSEKLLKTSRTCFGIGAAIWALNIIDAYFSTNSYNKRQFEKFYYGSVEKKPKGKFVPNVDFGMQNGKVTVGLAYRF